ncbi:MAG: LemA family protein [Pseudomonadales bacterium]|jgi:LemA protein
MLATIVVLGILLAAAVWIYNQLVRARNQVRNAWSDIDVQLARRHDLVPPLVSAVKAYADYEQATLTAVTELRTRAASAGRLPDKAALEDAMEKGLHRLIAVQESYPDLKADSNFRDLHMRLTEVEDHLQYARRFYNGSVRILNTRIESFPHLLVARPLGFQPAEFFEADEAARASVEVSLS